MKFVQFVYKNKPNDIRFGYVEGKCVVDVNAIEQYLPNTTLEYLKNFRENEKMLLELRDKHPTCTIGLNEVILKAPIHGMDKIICMSVNYLDYCETYKMNVPAQPIFYNKFASTVIGPNDPVQIRTDVTQKVDWQVELCVVISKAASKTKEEDAYQHVFGYTIAQNISARDWQRDKNGGQFLLGKSMDTFCPIGPWIVGVEDVGDPHNLDIRSMLNGVYKQKSNTKELIMKIPKIISKISRIMTLLPGDIILTGTPAGVGMYATPPEYLKPGDILRSEIEKIGFMETRFENYIRPNKYTE